MQCQEVELHTKAKKVVHSEINMNTFLFPNVYLGHHGHDLPGAELEGVLLCAGEVRQHPGVLKLARPGLDNELAHQVPDQSEGVIESTDQ